MPCGAILSRAGAAVKVRAELPELLGPVRGHGRFERVDAEFNAGANSNAPAACYAGCCAAFATESATCCAASCAGSTSASASVSAVCVDALLAASGKGVSDNPLPSLSGGGADSPQPQATRILNGAPRKTEQSKGMAASNPLMESNTAVRGRPANRRSKPERTCRGPEASPSLEVKDCFATLVKGTRQTQPPCALRFVVNRRCASLSPISAGPSHDQLSAALRARADCPRAMCCASAPPARHTARELPAPGIARAHLRATSAPCSRWSSS